MELKFKDKNGYQHEVDVQDAQINDPVMENYKVYSTKSFYITGNYNFGKIGHILLKDNEKNVYTYLDDKVHLIGEME